MLQSTNGSGDLAISQSIETVRFHNGQYLWFNDLPAYIAASHPG